MARTIIRRAAMTGIILSVFALGFVCGSATQPRASAQGLGGLLDQGGKMGGPLGAASQLGTSIVEMQDHVNGLQKNIDALQKVKAALTGK
jgi:hypothetical protein